MCTAFGLELGDRFFCRNLDLNGHFGERIVLTPRNFEWQFRHAGKQLGGYAMIGMAKEEKGFPLYAEAINEKGLAVAGLNFVGNAVFSNRICKNRTNVATFELIPWLLGRCATVGEAEACLSNLNLTDDCFCNALPAASLHWLITDGVRALTLESTRDGLRVYQNPSMTLTNNPPFPYLLANWLQMPSVAPTDCEFKPDRTIGVCTDSLGRESEAIPGGYSSTHRFLRTAWLLRNAKRGKDNTHNLATCFQILNSVAPIYGCVREPDGSEHYTVYSVCANLSKGIFYWKEGSGTKIVSVSFSDSELNATQLKSFDPIS